METFEGRRCCICGAAISDDNPDGIGFSCRKVYRKALWKVFICDDDRRNAYYGAMTAPMMELFIKCYKAVKFRSEFRKRFYSSVVKQYSTRGFVSKKQADIIRSLLSEKGFDWCKPLPEYVKAKKVQSDLYTSWTPSKAEAKHITNLANKLRHA